MVTSNKIRPFRSKVHLEMLEKVDVLRERERGRQTMAHVCINLGTQTHTSRDVKGTRIPMAPLSVVYTISSDPPGIRVHL